MTQCIKCARKRLDVPHTCKQYAQTKEERKFTMTQLMTYCTRRDIYVSGRQWNKVVLTNGETLEVNF